MQLHIRSVLLVASLVVLGVACAKPDPRLPVAGTVAYKGQPIKDGMIEFFALEGQKTAGTSAAIVNGGFQVPKDSGLLPGKYRVAIHSGSTGMTLPPEPPGPGVRVARELIPEKYNVKTTLTADVADPGPNTFDYNLTP